MKHIYESEVLNKLMERDGLNIPSSVPPYESEIKAYLINQVKLAYPKLTDYEAEWLLYNYTKHLPADFPIETITNVTEGIVNNVVPYAYKSAILKGQTLVNLLNDDNIEQRQASNTSSICGYDKETRTFHFITNLSHPFNNSYISSYGLDKNGIVKYFKNDTDYTIMWYGEKIRDDDDSQTVIRIGASENAYGKPSIYLKDANIKTGKMLYRTQTSYADSIIHPLGIQIVNTNNDIEYKLRFVILEGDYSNQDIPYFTGMQSVQMPVLESVGKNLFKGTTWTNNKSISSSGQLLDETDTNSTVSDYYNVEYLTKGIEYQIPSIINGTGGITIAYYDKDKNFIRRTFITSFILNENETYVRFKTSVDTSSVFQIEQGTQATSYEPYKSNILTVNEDVELRGIGDVKDELNVATGELTQRIEEVVLDGSESWQKYKDVDGFETYGYFTYFKGTYNGILCDRFKESSNKNIQPNYPTTKDEEAICIEGDHVKIRIKNISTVADLKLYLSQNPITIQYQLATESIKTVDLSIIDESGNEIKYFMPIEGTMHISTDGTPIKPTVTMEIPVEATTQNLSSFINMEMEE